MPSGGEAVAPEVWHGPSGTSRISQGELRALPTNREKGRMPVKWKGSWAARPLFGLLMVERMKKKFRVLGDGARGSHMARSGAERSAGGCRCRRRDGAGRGLAA
jgi:hypothetical protein